MVAVLILLLNACCRQVHVERKLKSQPLPSSGDGIQDSIRTNLLRKSSSLVLKYCAKKMYKEKERRVLGGLISIPSLDKNMMHFFMAL
jgi:hypothetical protein